MCELMDDDGRMADVAAVRAFGAIQAIPVITVAQIAAAL